MAGDRGFEASERGGQVRQKGSWTDDKVKTRQIPPSNRPSKAEFNFARLYLLWLRNPGKIDCELLSLCCPLWETILVSLVNAPVDIQNCG